MFDKPAVQAFINYSNKRSFGPKQTILNAGDESRAIFLILEGSVSVLTREGVREMVLAYLNPGEFFGEMSLFEDHAKRSAIVRTRTPILVAEVELDAFREFVRREPEIMFEVAGQLAGRLKDTSRRLRDLAFLDVSGRVAHELLQLCEKPGAVRKDNGVSIKLSRQELARIVGCSREMAGRVLKKLEEDGMIVSQGRSILVHTEPH